MNIAILTWLLKNKAALLQIVEIAKQFKKSDPYLAQWTLVDQIARIILPLLDADSHPYALMGALSYDSDDQDIALLAAGGEFHALGVDYALLINTILPAILAILELIYGRR